MEISPSNGWGTHQVVATITIKELGRVYAMYNHSSTVGVKLHKQEVQGFQLIFGDSSLDGIKMLHTVAIQFLNRTASLQPERNIRVNIELTM